MQYTEKELLSLISEVEKEFTTHLNKAEQLAKSESVEILAKAEGEDKPKEKKPEDKEDKKAAPAEGEKPEAKEAAPAEAKEAAPVADPAAPSPATDVNGNGIYDAEDMAHMEKMYASMSKEELILHHDAIKKALDASAAMAAPAPDADMNKMAMSEMGKAEITSHKEASGGQISKTGDPKATPGAKSPASKVEGVQMEKSENTELELAKAETAAANSKAVELQKNLDAASTFITKLVEKMAAPKGKAITSLDVIAKSEGMQEEKSLSKSEVTAVLAKKAADPSLKKSDRDAINAFYLNGASINTISHLLK